MWNISNILAGAASVKLFVTPTDYRNLWRTHQFRAALERNSGDTLFKQYLRERLLGQCLMTGLCLASIGVAVYGAVHDWSDLLVLPFALIPLALMLLIDPLHRLVSKNEQ